MSDYIKREDVKHVINKSKYYGKKVWYDILDDVYDIPSADVAQVRHGRWIEHYKSDAPPTLKERWICSWCGNVQTYGATGYCPNCGSKMDGGEDDD